MAQRTSLVAAMHQIHLIYRRVIQYVVSTVYVGVTLIWLPNYFYIALCSLKW